MIDARAVLIIDDDELLLDVLGEYLSEAGYRVYLARTGEEGLTLFLQNPDEIGLVLSDLGLPGMSGVDLLKKILELGPSTSAIAMSGFGGDEMLRQVEGMSRVDFLQKPFSRVELLNLVESRFGGIS